MNESHRHNVGQKTITHKKHQMTLLHKIQNQAKITYGAEVKMVVTSEEEWSVTGWAGHEVSFWGVSHGLFLYKCRLCNY